jgi:hypothetical protein
VVALTLKDDSDRPFEDLLSVIRGSGTPLVEITLPDRMAVFGEFYKWEIATVVAAALLGVDPFDEPNVKESKDMTASILSRVERTKSLDIPSPAVATDRLAVWGSPSGDGMTFPASLRAFFAPVKPPMYLSLLAYLNPTPQVEDAITRIRRVLGPALGVPTLFGWGPRYLHSIGQLYKGGPPLGAFIILTADHTGDLPIPGAPYTFGQLEMAQALGDFEALGKHSRPVLRIHLKGDPATALGELEQTMKSAFA